LALGRGMNNEHLPRHIAIIMDGNGRWATKRGLPRMAGHRAGVTTLHRVVKTCAQWGIPMLTVFAFSTENWHRPKDEVHFLLRLFEEVFIQEVSQLHANNVRVNVIGSRRNLAENTRSRIEDAEKLTANNSGLILNIAFNYGGRAEILNACRILCQQVQQHKLDPNTIDENMFSALLFTGGLPDPDLLIRTGGEMRVSNFLLWQIAYTEIYVTPIYWPDFQDEHLEQALLEYQKRDRRFGKV
jgi:undecaprenyl diphosphate synthase